MNDRERDIIDGMKDFADRLERGESVEATRVTREDTPGQRRQPRGPEAARQEAVTAAAGR